MSINDPQVLAQVLDTLEQVSQIAQDFARESGRQNARMDTLEHEVQKIRTLLTEGNGKALLTRVAVIEQRLDNPIDTSSKTTELERVEIERAKAKQALGDALKAWGPLGVGLAALVAALAAWLKTKGG